MVMGIPLFQVLITRIQLHSLLMQSFFCRLCVPLPYVVLWFVLFLVFLPLELGCEPPETQRLACIPREGETTAAALLTHHG